MGTNQWDPDSATSNRSVFFRSAQPVWKKGESTALHSRVVFLARLDYAKDASLTITGCNFYRVFLNGEFVGYGPARTSHGYAEVDSYPLNLSASRQNVLEIYALAYGSDNYYAPNEPAFLQAEVVANGTVLSATGKDFLLREWNEKIQKIIRYSFQRGFAEGYDFTRNPAEWEEPEIVEGRILLPRMVSYPTYREYRAATRERGRFEYTPRPIEDDPWLCSHFFRTFPSREYEMDAYRYGLCLTYEPNSSEKECKGGTYSIFALEASKTGFLHLKGRVKEESEIYLYFDEIDCHFGTKDRIDVNFRRSGCMNGVGLRLKTGEFDFVSFEPYSAKYVRLVVKYGHIENPEFSIQSYENPDADRFVLECDDPDIVRIAEASPLFYRRRNAR